MLHFRRKEHLCGSIELRVVSARPSGHLATPGQFTRTTGRRSRRPPAPGTAKGMPAAGGVAACLRVRRDSRTGSRDHSADPGRTPPTAGVNTPSPEGRTSKVPAGGALTPAREPEGGAVMVDVVMSQWPLL